jgi:hypothetical protein
MSVRDGLEVALLAAGDAHQDAVVVTLTTNAKRFNGLDAALSNLYDAKSRLLAWLSTDYKLGSRPSNLSVLEFTESGLPHVHVVLFGLNWAVPQSVLSQKWDELGQGSVVDIRAARRRGDDWLLHNDDGGTTTLRQYLGKAISGLQTLAQSDAGDVRDAAESGDVSLWRQALYWATERQYYSCSSSLKPDTDDNRLPHITQWEFVGVDTRLGLCEELVVVLPEDRPVRSDRLETLAVTMVDQLASELVERVEVTVETVSAVGRPDEPTTSEALEYSIDRVAVVVGRLGNLRDCPWAVEVVQHLRAFSVNSSAKSTWACRRTRSRYSSTARASEGKIRLRRPSRFVWTSPSSARSLTTRER